MHIIKRKHFLTLIFTAITVIFFATISTADEKFKIESKAYGVFTKMNQSNLDDVEGHTLASYESEGAGTGGSGGFTFLSQGMSDLVKGNGSHNGYYKVTDQNGDLYFSKWQGEVTTTASPEGRPIVKFGGTWSFTRGTGRYENAQGGGTYKGWFIGRNIYTIITEGELTLKSD